MTNGCPKKYEILNVIITTEYKEGDIDLQWAAKNIGYGHLAFKLMPDGKIRCNNEAMSRDFVKAVLYKLADIAVLEDDNHD
jgi:hypothetical protein